MGKPNRKGACTRFFAVPPGAFSNSCCTSRRFSAVLEGAFCCTCTRLWAWPSRPRIHPRKRKQNGRSTAPPNPPDLGGPPAGGPRPGPSRLAEPRDRGHGRPVPYPYAGPVRPRQTSDRAGRRAEPGRLPRIEHARRHWIQMYAPPRDGSGRPGFWLKKSLAAVRLSVRSLAGRYSGGILPV